MLSSDAERPQSVGPNVAQGFVQRPEPTWRPVGISRGFDAGRGWDDWLGASLGRVWPPGVVGWSWLALKPATDRKESLIDESAK